MITMQELEEKLFSNVFLVPFSGQQVIVCAHRYVKNETDQRWGHGQCFTLTQDLKHSATWDPCEGRLKQKYVYITIIKGLEITSATNELDPHS